MRLLSFVRFVVCVTERFALPSFPSWVSAHDLDADGDADLVVATTDNTLILRNRGDATFVATSYPPSSGFRQTIADMDGDGDPDILTASYRGGRVHLLGNLGNGNFSPEHEPQEGDE